MFRTCKLGLREHDQERVDRVVKLAPYHVDPFEARTPKDWALGQPWDDDCLDNDVLGNCGPAAAVNWLKAVAAANGRTNLVFDVEDVRDAYGAMGWDGTEATDNGVVLLDLMEWWSRHPIGGFQLDCFFSIGYLDPQHLATALQIAPVIVGAQLTTDCQQSRSWGAPEAAGAHVWGGHAYLVHSDSPGGGMGKSWGTSIWTSPPFRARRWRECYLPICQELMGLPDAVLLRLLNVARGL